MRQVLSTWRAGPGGVLPRGPRWPGTRSRAPGHQPNCEAELAHSPDGLRLRASVTLRDLEFDPLPLFEAAVAIHLDGGEVHEHVPATVDRDEAVALVRVEPLDGALSHYQQLPNSARASGSPLAFEEPVHPAAGWADPSQAYRCPDRQRPETTLPGAVGVGDL